MSERMYRVMDYGVGGKVKWLNTYLVVEKTSSVRLEGLLNIAQWARRSHLNPTSAVLFIKSLTWRPSTNRTVFGHQFLSLKKRIRIQEYLHFLVIFGQKWRWK